MYKNKKKTNFYLARKPSQPNFNGIRLGTTLRKIFPTWDEFFYKGNFGHFFSSAFRQTGRFDRFKPKSSNHFRKNFEKQLILHFLEGKIGRNRFLKKFVM